MRGAPSDEPLKSQVPTIREAMHGVNRFANSEFKKSIFENDLRGKDQRGCIDDMQFTRDNAFEKERNIAAKTKRPSYARDTLYYRERHYYVTSKRCEYRGRWIYRNNRQ